MRGRKPKPAAMKRAAGNPGKRRIPETPVYTPSGIEPPAGLEDDALEEWNRLAPVLVTSKVLEAPDRNALEAYCVNFALWKQARAELAASGSDGLVVSTPNGYSQENPLIGIMKKAQEAMRQWGAELGLSPASRMRLGKPSGEGNGKPAGDEGFFGKEPAPPPPREAPGEGPAGVPAGDLVN